jgi:phosphinothricin acetyltransferase
VTAEASGADVLCREATERDAARIAAIYNTVIVDSHVSFDLEPHTAGDRRRWLQARAGSSRHQAWVAEVDGDVVGIAYSSPWRPKEAYALSVETTIVLDPAWTGRGIGSLLYTALLDAVTAAGAHRAYAVVALPNDESLRLHHKLGFRTVGVLDEAGHKMGRWWSTEILEKPLD